MNTSIVTNTTSTESSIKPFLKLAISLIFAFAGFSLSVIAMMFIGFLKISFIKPDMEFVFTKPDLESLMSTLFFTLVVALYYSVFLLPGLVIPFFSIGIPAALIGWKFKIIRWWTCLIGAGLITAYPLALIATPSMLGTFIIGFMKGDWFYVGNNVIDITGLYLGSVFCGSISGLCFWLALRLLRFSDINGSIAYPLQFSR